MAQVATTRTQFQEKLKLLLTKDDRDCKLLVNVYNDVKTCVENISLIRETVLQLKPDFVEHAKQGIKDLEKVDRPILVIGESSAGKSSFLNLLIGRTILPELARPCTHCMCCIKKGTKLEAHVSSFDGSKWHKTEIIRKDGKSDEEFQGKLEALVNEGNCKKALDRCIEIFVPSSLLEDNVYLVDTPGFGDKKQVTKSLVKYLPNAIGIIFILNATVCVGMTEDRGVLILNEIKRLRQEGKLPSFDPTKIIFIGNKWDQVPEKERKDHRLKSIGKMKRVWPHFQEDQFLPLSVAYCKKSIIHDDYKSATEDYQKVLDEIRKTVEHCCNARSQVHKKFLFRVFEHVKIFVDTMVAHRILSVEEKQAKVKKLEGLVKDMESEYERGKAKIDGLATDTHKKAVEDFHQYLNDVVNWGEIFPWKKSNIPEGTDLCAVKEKAFEIIRTFITQSFAKRIVMHKLELLVFTRTLTMLTSLMKTMRTQIKNVLSGTNDDAARSNEENDLTGGDIVVLVLSAPSPSIQNVRIYGWGAISSLFYLLDMVTKIGEMRKYKNNPREYLDRWSEEFITKKCSKEELKKMISQAMSVAIRITESMNDMEKTIKLSKDSFHNFENSVNEVPEGFYEIRDLCRRMDEKLSTTAQS